MIPIGMVDQFLLLKFYLVMDSGYSLIWPLSSENNIISLMSYNLIISFTQIVFVYIENKKNEALIL
jgi:hypothetical protein